MACVSFPRPRLYERSQRLLPVGVEVEILDHTGQREDFGKFRPQAA
jgi:hypothetical protein